MTAMEKWQSAHEAICAMRWKVLQRIAVIGFAWLTVLVIGTKAPFAEALLKLLP